MHSFNVTFACSDYEQTQTHKIIRKTSGSSLRYIFFCISIKFFNYIVSFHATLTCGENEQTQAQKIMFKASSLSLRNATTV